MYKKQAIANVLGGKDINNMFLEYCIKLDDTADITLLKTGGFIERGYEESIEKNYFN